MSGKYLKKLKTVYRCPWTSPSLLTTCLLLHSTIFLLTWLNNLKSNQIMSISCRTAKLFLTYCILVHKQCTLTCWTNIYSCTNAIRYFIMKKVCTMGVSEDAMMWKEALMCYCGCSITLMHSSVWSSKH